MCVCGWAEEEEEEGTASEVQVLCVVQGEDDISGGRRRRKEMICQDLRDLRILTIGNQIQAKIEIHCTHDTGLLTTSFVIKGTAGRSIYRGLGL